MPPGRRPIFRGAAVGAAAYHAGKKREQRREREPLESQEAAPAPQAAADAGATSPDVIQQLKQLGELHEQGVLTDEEFAQQKARLLG